MPWIEASISTDQQTTPGESMVRGAADTRVSPAIDRPIFILGTQRSGTTLLCSMFDRHPDVAAINEFWDGYDHLSGQVQKRDAFLAALTWRFRLEPGELVMAAMAKPFQLYRQAIVSLLRRERKSRFLLKDPALNNYVTMFDNEFPDARYIYLVRDPRATCLSQLSQHWNVANVYHAAKLCRKDYEILSAFLQTHPERIQFLRFKDLLSEPEKHLRKLCEFVELEFDPRMLTFYEDSGDRRIHAGNENITRPLQENVAEKWKTKLSHRQIAMIEHECREMMMTFGYDPMTTGKTTGVLRRTLFDLHQWFWTTYWWQRRTDWSGLKRLPSPVQSVVKRTLNAIGLAGEWRK